MTKETIAALSELDLSELKAAPARRVLLIAREGAATEPDLAAGLRRLGSDVAEENIPGYAAAMTDPHKSVVPDRVLEAVVRWFSQGPKSPGKDPARRDGVLISERMRIHTAEADSEVDEEPLYFGKRRTVFGIVSENSEKERRSKTAVIFLNAGHIHRIGPNRFYTRFARHWAARGVTCLRIDLSGIGDSPGERPPGEPSFDDAAAKNVDEAMDLLRSTRSIKRFALIGLCSGAYTAFHASLRSRSVAAEILVNPPAFYSRPGGASIANYNEALSHKRALLRKESWRKALRGEVDFSNVLKVAVERSRNLGKEAAAAIADLVQRRARSDDDLLRAFRRMAGRKVNTLLVFSRNDGGIPDIEEKLGSRAEKAAGPCFKLEIVDGADHTFSPLRSQDRLCALLTEHVSRLLGA